MRLRRIHIVAFLIMLLKAQLAVGQLNNTRSRAEHILLIGMNCNNSFPVNDLVFKIAVLDKDSELTAILNQLSEKSRINNKNVEIVHLRNEYNIPKTDILYVSPNYNWNYSYIDAALPIRNTLVISEKRPFEKTTVGFLPVNNSIKIEVNEKNLAKTGFSFNDEFMKITLREPDHWRTVCNLYEQITQNYTEKNLAINKQKEEIEKARHDAEKANEAKSIFLANMSHEIRTPMNSILGFTGLLSEIVEDEKQKVYLNAINTGGKNLLTLINDILDLSKIEAGKLELNYEPVKPEKVVYEIETIFSLKIQEKGIKLSININENVPDNILIDEIRLRQILLNLIGNAVKFTEEGEITIEIDAQQTGETEDTKIKQFDLKISVKDTGVGISKKALNEIFDAFKQQNGQSTKKYEGTGLGLAITKRLVEMMNGKIFVDSKLGKGSTFSVVFGNVSSVIISDTNNDKNSTDYSKIVFDSAKILVVDDISHNRELIKAFLQNKQPNLIIFEAKNIMLIIRLLPLLLLQ